MGRCDRAERRRRRRQCHAHAVPGPQRTLHAVHSICRSTATGQKRRKCPRRAAHKVHGLAASRMPGCRPPSVCMASDGAAS